MMGCLLDAAQALSREAARERARRLGFTVIRLLGFRHLLVPEAVRDRAACVVRSLVLHKEHNDSMDVPTHFARNATKLALSRGAIDEGSSRAAHAAHRAANRAKHSWPRPQGSDVCDPLFDSDPWAKCLSRQGRLRPLSGATAPSDQASVMVGSAHDAVLRARSLWSAAALAVPPAPSSATGPVETEPLQAHVVVATAERFAAEEQQNTAVERSAFVERRSAAVEQPCAAGEWQAAGERQYREQLAEEPHSEDAGVQRSAAAEEQYHAVVERQGATMEQRAAVVQKTAALEQLAAGGRLVAAERELLQVRGRLLKHDQPCRRLNDSITAKGAALEQLKVEVSQLGDQVRRAFRPEAMNSTQDDEVITAVADAPSVPKLSSWRAPPSRRAPPSQEERAAESWRPSIARHPQRGAGLVLHRCRHAVQPRRGGLCRGRRWRFRDVRSHTAGEGAGRTAALQPNA